METIITYLLEKGGMFGVLLAIAFAWIVYREKYFYDKKDKGEDKKPEVDNEKIEKILFIVEDLKSKKDNSSAKTDIEKMLYILDNLREDQNQLKIKVQEILSIVDDIPGLDQEMEKKIQELLDLHSVFDEDGVPVWYVRKSLTESINNLEETVELLQTKIQQNHETLRKELLGKLQKINDDRVGELKELLETYNKTVTDLILALEKLKVLIKTGEE